MTSKPGKLFRQTETAGPAPPLSGGDLDRLFTASLWEALAGSARPGNLNPGPVLILPPDNTRIHSRAGLLTDICCREFAGPLRRAGWSLAAIMPALGTHRPMDAGEIAAMFPGSPGEKFLPHRWREDTVELGRISAEWVQAAFSGGDTVGGDFSMDWPVQVNRLLRDGLPGAGPFSLIISIGQVVPHEVIGMANHSKNIFIGTGGSEAINKSHYLGALYGLERLMGRTDTPVRSLLDEGLHRYGSLLPPILWALTVVDSANRIRGLFSGFDRTCFEEAAALSRGFNMEKLEQGADKIVVWLSPQEYRSTWLGNKAIYRTRMAMAQGGELLILAPALERFGEDEENDRLIRRHGYRGEALIRTKVREDPALAASLSAAAHLIHGSSEERFTIRYCTSGGAGLGKEDIEGVGYEWGELSAMAERYLPGGPGNLASGWHTTNDGERYFFVENPALGLWTV